MKAMRTGRHMATSRPIQPPMPWPWVGKATNADLKAIFAYLKSIPADCRTGCRTIEPPRPAPRAAVPTAAPRKWTGVLAGRSLGFSGVGRGLRRARTRRVVVIR